MQTIVFLVFLTFSSNKRWCRLHTFSFPGRRTLGPHEGPFRAPARWQVATLPMMEREMITMIVDTLPVFYYEKMVGYMPSSFADLVFVSERIEVGLKRGKFNYASPTSTSNRRFGASGAKKERDAHAVTSTSTWDKPQQTHHNPTYQYYPHQPSFLANIGNTPNPAPVQQRLFAQPKRSPPQNSQSRPAGSSNPSISTNPGRNFPVTKLVEFTPIPMPYADLLPSLITIQMAVVNPKKIYQSPFPNVTCAYLGGVPGHSIE